MDAENVIVRKDTVALQKELNTEEEDMLDDQQRREHSNDDDDDCVDDVEAMDAESAVEEEGGDFDGGEPGSGSEEGEQQGSTEWEDEDEGEGEGDGQNDSTSNSLPDQSTEQEMDVQEEEGEEGIHDGGEDDEDYVQEEEAEEYDEESHTEEGNTEEQNDDIPESESSLPTDDPWNGHSSKSSVRHIEHMGWKLYPAYLPQIITTDKSQHCSNSNTLNDQEINNLEDPLINPLAALHSWMDVNYDAIKLQEKEEKILKKLLFQCFNHDMKEKSIYMSNTKLKSEYDSKLSMLQRDLFSTEKYVRHSLNIYKENSNIMNEILSNDPNESNNLFYGVSVPDNSNKSVHSNNNNKNNNIYVHNDNKYVSHMDDAEEYVDEKNYGGNKDYNWRMRERTTLSSITSTDLLQRARRYHKRRRSSSLTNSTDIPFNDNLSMNVAPTPSSANHGKLFGVDRVKFDAPHPAAGLTPMAAIAGPTPPPSTAGSYTQQQLYPASSSTSSTGGYYAQDQPSLHSLTPGGNYSAMNLGSGKRAKQIITNRKFFPEMNHADSVPPLTLYNYDHLIQTEQKWSHVSMVSGGGSANVKDSPCVDSEDASVSSAGGGTSTTSTINIYSAALQPTVQVYPDLAIWTNPIPWVDIAKEFVVMDVHDILVDSWSSNLKRVSTEESGDVEQGKNQSTYSMDGSNVQYEISSHMSLVEDSIMNDDHDQEQEQDGYPMDENTEEEEAIKEVKLISNNNNDNEYEEENENVLIDSTNELHPDDSKSFLDIPSINEIPLNKLHSESNILSSITPSHMIESETVQDTFAGESSTNTGTRRGRRSYKRPCVGRRISFGPSSSGGLNSRILAPMFRPICHDYNSITNDITNNTQNESKRDIHGELLHPLSTAEGSKSTLCDRAQALAQSTEMILEDTNNMLEPQIQNTSPDHPHHNDNNISSSDETNPPVLTHDTDRDNKKQKREEIEERNILEYSDELEEDVSDAAVMARHDFVLQRMRLKYAHLHQKTALHNGRGSRGGSHVASVSSSVHKAVPNTSNNKSNNIISSMKKKTISNPSNIIGSKGDLYSVDDLPLKSGR